MIVNENVLSADLEKMEDLYEALEIAAKVHGLKAVAAAADKAYSTLANELSRQPTYKLGLSTAMVIISVTRKMAPLKALNRLFGCVPVPVPERPWGSVRDILSGSAEIAMGFAGVAETLAMAMADGMVTGDERTLCRAKIAELLEAVLRVDAWLSEGE